MNLILIADEALQAARAEAFISKQEVHAAQEQTAITTEKLAQVQSELDDLKVAYQRPSRKR